MAADILSTDVMVVIAVMALVTITLRLSGFWLMRFVPMTPTVKRMLEALPGSVIAAAVLPVAVQGGGVAALAVVASVTTMWFVRSDFIAVVVGMGLAALVRLTGLS